MMKKTMKKPVKKADGGMMVGIPVGERGGPGPAIRPMPGPRPGGGGMSRPVAPGGKPGMTRPGMPSQQMPSRPAPGPGIKSVGGGRAPTTPMVKPIPAMRKAKGGMAEGGNWIQDAIKKPGALRSALGAKKGEPIPMGKLEKAASSKNPKMAKRANLAMTLRGMKKK